MDFVRRTPEAPELDLTVCNEYVKKFMNATNLNEAVSRSLLRTHNWDINRAIGVQLGRDDEGPLPGEMDYVSPLKLHGPES
eukprot:CAMPEP_0113712278 /NCGR_PEP_ID=MMETSP0038_2-20120614/31288_1 /TAXON_ID=2898 /ORGANISM="Cryptomonas paramecium" /LENGTH=80 /DNA_ID=CAMNT_0000638757 /DNA_START=96 /DNA_END=335 /DNA_ORIENTATION=- /assembly_acc=CAM_ASM_000170